MMTIKNISSMKRSNYSMLRYWLLWVIVIFGLAYGIHRYFEYRDYELDKRLEQLRLPK